ncbi:hypothetical protein ACW2Q0_07510 [Nocardia sp. R16R-3T]
MTERGSIDGALRLDKGLERTIAEGGDNRVELGGEGFGTVRRGDESMPLRLEG